MAFLKLVGQRNDPVCPLLCKGGETSPPFRKGGLGAFWPKSRPADQRGFGLVETVVSIAVLSLTFVALVGAMATGFLGFRVVEEDVTAGRLATGQMEYTKAYKLYRAAPCPAPCPDYPIDPTITPIPAGYTVTVAVDDTVPYRGPDIEKIIITVTHGVFSKKLEDYKRIQ